MARGGGGVGGHAGVWGPSRKGNGQPPNPSLTEWEGPTGGEPNEGNGVGAGKKGPRGKGEPHGTVVVVQPHSSNVNEVRNGPMECHVCVCGSNVGCGRVHV